MRDFLDRPRTPAPDPRREKAAAFAKRKDALRAAIRSDAGLTFAEKHIALRLVELIHAEHQVAWPSAMKLASDVGCTERTVWRAIKKLDGRHFDRVLTSAGRHNAYHPRWPDEHAPLTQASPPYDTDVRGPLTQASYEIDKLNPESNPESVQSGFAKDQAIESDVEVEDNSGPTEQAAPSAPVARQESDEDVVNAEPCPDTPSVVAQIQATLKLKAVSAELKVDDVTADFVKARQRQRRMGRDPGPVDKGFDRYVRKAISAHCGETREDRLRKMEEAFGLDPRRRPVRSESRVALDAKVFQSMGYGRGDACTG